MPLVSCRPCLHEGKHVALAEERFVVRAARRDAELAARDQRAYTGCAAESQECGNIIDRDQVFDLRELCRDPIAVIALLVRTVVLGV